MHKITKQITAKNGIMSEEKIQKSTLPSPPALHMQPGVLGWR